MPEGILAAFPSENNDTGKVFFLGSLLALLKGALQKNYVAMVLGSFPLLQLLVYGIGAAASDRFFITLLPFWILSTVYWCNMILKNKH